MSEMPAPRRRKRKRRKNQVQKNMLIALCAVLAVILVVLILATAYAEHWLGLINREETRGTLSSSELENLYGPDETTDPNWSGTEISTVTWDTTPPETIFDGEEYVNILLIGQDRRWNESVGRSDAMVLLTFNKNTNSIYMTSFLRDLYVQIPGYKDNRINAAYPIGGMELLKETIYHNFGVPIDGCAAVDFFRFPEIVDMLGGLDLELTQAEADYLNENGNWGLGPAGSDWTLTAGVNHMTGEQCLAYSRIRKIDSDFHRTSRQHNVLMALVGKVKDLSITDAMGLLDTFLPMVTTDMTNKEILTHVASLFPMLANSEFKTQRVPKWQQYENVVVNGMQVLLPDLGKIRQELINTLHYDAYVADTNSPSSTGSKTDE